VAGLTIGSIARPWKPDRAYRAYVLAQVVKSQQRQHSIVRDRVRRLVRLARLYATPGPVLCLGCRNVHELDVWEDADYGPVIGIDLAGDGERVQPMDMHRLRFPAQSFSVLFACHSLEHAYDLDVVLSECARVTKPGGIWAIEVPIGFTPTEVDRQDLGSVEAWQARCVAAGASRVLHAEASKDGMVARLMVQVPA
jgi:SAM-dependent methyltransferase